MEGGRYCKAACGKDTGPIHHIWKKELSNLSLWFHLCKSIRIFQTWGEAGWYMMETTAACILEGCLGKVTLTWPDSCSACVCVCSVMSDPLRSQGLQPARLFCPWDFQARILERVAISFSNPGIKSMSLASPAFAGRFFTTVLLGKPAGKQPTSLGRLMMVLSKHRPLRCC